MPSQWFIRLRALFRREEIEADFEEELRYHVDREIERNLARGLSPEEARRAARRGFGDPGAVKAEARETWRWRWVDELAQDVGSRERFALVLMAAFAAVALMLAALGLYGVLAYTMRQRTQEIGIRIALGATASHVRMLVLHQAAVVVGLGLVVGIAGALVLGRWLSALVFEISPRDPRIFLATSLVLAMAALLSAWIPTRHASRVDPRIAIQEQ
ncbi:MAG: FtsX-like permease family protein [Longimicrobiales bacterium]